jgi:transcription factor WhiB
MVTTNWMPQASCRHSSLDFFDPSKADECKALCATCPVRAECLRYCMEMERGYRECDRVGVWGGATPEERYKHYRGNTKGDGRRERFSMRSCLVCMRLLPIEDFARSGPGKRRNHCKTCMGKRWNKVRDVSREFYHRWDAKTMKADIERGA